MISFEPPLAEIDGIPIFSDHRDPKQFYYMPIEPKFAGEAQNDPHFSFLKYRLLGEEDSYIGLGAERKELGGGYVSFDTNLAVSTERVADIQKELQKTYPGAGLHPVDFHKATVRLVTLKPEEGDFVSYIAGEGSGAVFPQHFNAFAMELSGPGATLLWEGFKGASGPVGVGYDLWYRGVRPSLDVRITVDFAKIYKHFSAHFRAKYLFASVDIKGQWDKLKKVGAVKIEWLGDAEGKTQKLIENVIEQVTDKVMTKLFEAHTPAEPAEHKGKMGWWGAGLALKKVDDRDLIKVTWDLRKQIVEERMVPISAHLTGFYDKFGSDERYFREVDLNDPFFRKIAVDVMCNANFEKDPIHSIVTTLKYDDPENNVSKVTSFLFNDSATVHRFEAPQENSDRYTFQYKVDVNYKPSRHFDNLREEGDWVISGDRKLVINKNAFGMLYVDMMLAYPLEDVRFVKLDLFYEDTPNMYQQREHKLFRTGEEMFTWQIPLRNKNLRQYKYRLTVYTRERDDQGRYITRVHPWVDTEDDFLILEP